LLRDYRDWLRSELQLLANASHHAYALGQANMAKRALDELDHDTAHALWVGLDSGIARRALIDIELLEQRETAVPPGLVALRDALRSAIDEARLPADEGV
jgi:hypothetical protein